MSSSDTPTEEAPAEETIEADAAREELLGRLSAELGDAVVGSYIRPGDDLWVRVDRAAWRATAAYLRHGMGFAYFGFLSAIDWMPSPFGRDMDAQVDLTLDPPEPKDPEEQATGYAGGDTRFQVFMRVNDVVGLRSLTIKADVADDDPHIDSIVSVYPGANWHERECWEMYGIDFADHPGLRHIYLPSEFEGNPLRKDYPLLARRVKPWPGIVDVEQMPGDDDEDTDDAEGHGV